MFVKNKTGFPDRRLCHPKRGKSVRNKNLKSGTLKLMFPMLHTHTHTDPHRVQSLKPEEGGPKHKTEAIANSRLKL